MESSADRWSCRSSRTASCPNHLLSPTIWCHRPVLSDLVLCVRERERESERERERERSQMLATEIRSRKTVAKQLQSQQNHVSQPDSPYPVLLADENFEVLCAEIERENAMTISFLVVRNLVVCQSVRTHCYGFAFEPESGCHLPEHEFEDAIWVVHLGEANLTNENNWKKACWWKRNKRATD